MKNVLDYEPFKLLKMNYPIININCIVKAAAIKEKYGL